MPTNSRSCARRSRRRTGAAAAELAVCLPTIVLLIFGSIESCNMIFLQQAMNVAAYEGVRAAIRTEGTNADVQSRCNQILTARKVQSSTVTMSPTDVFTAPRGTRIAVTVSAPCSSNAYSPAWFYNGRTVSGVCTMVKE